MSLAGLVAAHKVKASVIKGPKKGLLLVLAKGFYRLPCLVVNGREVVGMHHMQSYIIEVIVDLESFWIDKYNDHCAMYRAVELEGVLISLIHLHILNRYIVM